MYKNAWQTSILNEDIKRKRFYVAETGFNIVAEVHLQSLLNWQVFQ